MKTLFVSILFISSVLFPTRLALTPIASDILGTYWNEEKDAKIRIYLAQNGKYAGKIEWMKEPNDASGKPKLDNLNPNSKLRSNPRLGLAIMKNFEFNAGNKRWEDGTIYDPKNGKTYDGYMYFDGKQTDKLSLRGYVLGMSMLGRTSTWERVK
jgi:uncharacterized protein (DUF2147 family)